MQGPVRRTERGCTVAATKGPFSGNQNGRAVFYANGATGMVSGNAIDDYQKNGVVLTGSQTTCRC